MGAATLYVKEHICRDGSDSPVCRPNSAIDFLTFKLGSIMRLLATSKTFLLVLFNSFLDEAHAVDFESCKRQILKEWNQTIPSQETIKDPDWAYATWTKKKWASGVSVSIHYCTAFVMFFAHCTRAQIDHSARSLCSNC